ncbi:N-acetyltransferase [Saccharopolyspora phatthalungensis]|uniref:RimJ/RimL family protein N-acetyltransferase n=1 Tax=Saccharopolyspora phatthalungensis TaxID=664693 RepID=A0A840QFC4_9PSEU|nr:N-acetyltransferase [Saccharopolyspora phatthalungensis]MBB5159534.1 RimJ/RimL family protein N-acetyltransferase [Saccharopolyspora phatthalungensis]
MSLVALRYRDRPDLWSRLPELFAGVWPEYNLHGDVMAGGRWERLHRDFDRYQFVLYDEEADDVVAAARSIPVTWNGNAADLGSGLDEAITGSFDTYDRGVQPNVLCAIGIEVPPRHQGSGYAGRMLDEVCRGARSCGLSSVIVPVRPTRKDRYPLTPIEQYARWTREDGTPFDPWVRLHVRHGGVIAKAIPLSSRITGSVAEWESWTGMAFPGDGDYIFPGGLAPLHIDRGRDLGSYWEPNVWIVHPTDITAEPEGD